MRASRIILLLVALLAGGLAAFLATRGDAPQQQAVAEPVVVQEAKTKIVVAKSPIGVGQRLSADTIEWQDWPEGAVRAEYVTMAAMPDALTELNGSVARFEFFPGEPILEQKLVKTNSGLLSAVLAKGMRAVSVQVAAESASGGYILPNDRVDVVLTRESTNGRLSETILTNIKVLAIGLRLGQIGTTGAPADPQDPKADVFQDKAIATLEVDPIQGEQVINGSKDGELSLVLRSIADFADARGQPLRQPATNAAIRVIRYGQNTDIMASRPVAALSPAAIDLPDSPSSGAASAVPPTPMVQ